MALFRGTFNEFYQWADPRTRFWITQETQKHRRKLGACPRCKKEGVSLTSAHATPRKDVVRTALGVTDDAQEIEIDLSDAWAKIKAAHRPFDEKFRYLCEQCHREVDAAPASAEAAASSPPSPAEP